MSWEKTEIGEEPEATRRVAQAAFANGTLNMQMRDQLGAWFEEGDFRMLYAREGQKGYTAWRLVVVTLMQFNEDLTDREAADAVRGRIDWKYALGLELEDAGFNYSILSEFRERMMEGEAGQYFFEMLLKRCQALKLVKSGGHQRTNARHMLAVVRALNREEVVGESLRAALNALAEVVPEWLKVRVRAEWYARYGRRVERSRLPKSEAERRAWAEQTGREGPQLMTWLHERPSQAECLTLPMLIRLGTIWSQQFQLEAGTVRWRTTDALPPTAEPMDSPYDDDASGAIDNPVSPRLGDPASDLSRWGLEHQMG